MTRAAADGADAHAVLRQAAEWFATLHAGAATASERADWQRWLAAHPEHRKAWERIEAVERRFGAVPAEPALAALGAPRARRAAAKKLLALAAVATVGTALARREGGDYLAALGAEQRTAVGEVRRLALADGTDLWMNTDSALDLDMAARRRLVLHRGEILVQGGAAPAHPLRVDVADARLTAAGTRFGIRRDGATASLSVFAGAVRIELASGGASRLARAGTRVRFGAGTIGPAEAADDMRTAWIRKRLSVEGMPLGEFVADLGRYWRGHIGCHPALAGMRLTGSYPLDDIDRVLSAVAATLPLRVRRILPWWVTLEPAA